MATIDGTNDAESLDGTAGDDVIHGYGGSDTIMGYAGNDLLFGGNEADTLNGGRDADTLVGGQGGDDLVGGNGNDMLYGASRADGDTDTFADTLNGGKGDDQFWAQSGDIVKGGHGQDTAVIDLSTDTVGVMADLTANDSGNTSDLGGGASISSIEHGSISFGSGNDTIELGKAQIEIFAGDGDDSVSGTGTLDVIHGGGGNDTINGGGGVDYIGGGNDNDMVNAGSGNDVIDTGVGNDTVSGGYGTDTFVFSGLSADTTTEITDLTNKETINLSAIDADSTTDGDQAFTSVDSFSGHAGEFTTTYDRETGVTQLLLDTDGDSTGDITINLDGWHLNFDGYVL